MDDIERAKQFYGDTLGLQVTEANGMLTLHIEGGAEILAYPKGADHTPETFTILNFPVDNIEKVVDGLVARGVTFERYDAMASNTDEAASGAVEAHPSPGSTRQATFCRFSRRVDRLQSHPTSGSPAGAVDRTGWRRMVRILVASVRRASLR